MLIGRREAIPLGLLRGSSLLERKNNSIYTFHMKRALLRWNVLCIIGMSFLALTALCFILKAYVWLIAGLAIGLLLTSQSWKRISLLKNAAKAIEDGTAEVEVFYKSRKQKENLYQVIPAGGDILYLYGFSQVKNDIMVFRWERIQRVVENGIELQKEDYLERVGVSLEDKKESKVMD